MFEWKPHKKSLGPYLGFNLPIDLSILRLLQTISCFFFLADHIKFHLTYCLFVEFLQCAEASVWWLLIKGIQVSLEASEKLNNWFQRMKILGIVSFLFLFFGTYLGNTLWYGNFLSLLFILRFKVAQNTESSQRHVLLF